ncbi:MAG: DUF1778 domain-containing protein [Gemmatimonadota bacterium]
MRRRPLLIAARVTAAEKAIIVAAAAAEELSVSEFVLRAALNRTGPPLRRLNQLRFSRSKRSRRRTA